MNTFNHYSDILLATTIGKDEVLAVAYQYTIEKGGNKLMVTMA
jgi:hypothetical protein